MFTLRKLSTDNGDESREYQSREAARDVMRTEYNAVKSQYEDTHISEDDAVCADAESNRYIGWLIYETPDANDILTQADIALAAAEMGLSQYSYELLDSDACGKYIAEARFLLDKSRIPVSPIGGGTDTYTITFDYEELDAVFVALACYELEIKKERQNGRTDHPERAARVLEAISTASAKMSVRRYPKRPDRKERTNRHVCSQGYTPVDGGDT